MNNTNIEERRDETRIQAHTRRHAKPSPAQPSPIVAISNKYKSIGARGGRVAKNEGATHRQQQNIIILWIGYYLRRGNEHIQFGVVIHDDDDDDDDDMIHANMWDVIMDYWIQHNPPSHSQTHTHTHTKHSINNISTAK